MPRSSTAVPEEVAVIIWVFHVPTLLGPCTPPDLLPLTCPVLWYAQAAGLKYVNKIVCKWRALVLSIPNQDQRSSSWPQHTPDLFQSLLIRKPVEPLQHDLSGEVHLIQLLDTCDTGTCGLDKSLARTPRALLAHLCNTYCIKLAIFKGQLCCCPRHNGNVGNGSPEAFSHPLIGLSCHHLQRRVSPCC